MKCISLLQPWANRIAYGSGDHRKTIETRTWSTPYRGDLVIVSSKRPDPMSAILEADGDCLYGMALCVVELYDCRPMAQEDEEDAMCSWSPGRWAWCLRNVRQLDPFPVRGQLGLYEIELPEDTLR